MTGVVGAERERWLEESKRSAEEWPAKLAKEKQRREAARVEQEAERAKREAEQEAERVKQETERDQLEAREAEAEERAAEERIRAAEERQRAAEAKRPAIEAAAEERRRAAEERRLAAEKATAAKQRAAEAERRAAEEERRNLEKTQRATEEEGRALAAERAAAATEQQAKREAEMRERHRRGIFGEEDLRAIIHAADHNTVRFERDYKGRTFSGVGAFEHAGKANLGFGNSIALHISVRDSEVVCFVHKSKADVVADFRTRSRVRFTGTISNTALLGETLQLQDCTVSGG